MFNGLQERLMPSAAGILIGAMPWVSNGMAGKINAFSCGDMFEGGMPWVSNGLAGKINAFSCRDIHGRNVVGV